MIRRNFAWRGVAVLGVAALALGACADGDNGNGDGPGEEAFSGTLKIGTILPETGSLAFLGPPEFAGVDLAIKDINDAGGVWGNPVEVIHRDSGDTSTDIASQNADFLISQDVHAIIGAASSGVSMTFIEKLYDNKILQVSPANTSPEFTTHDKGEYYFRTAPSDVLQGSVLGDLILADGHTTLGILALQDAYGTGLANHLDEVFTEGGGDVVEKLFYDPTTSEFSAEATTLKAAAPEAVVVIAFDETSQIVPSLVEAGLGTDEAAWYFVDGNLANYGDEFPEGTLEGVKGTLAGPAEDPTEFYDRLLEVDPSLDDFSYGPEAYDATILTALAAVAANSDDPDAIRAKMVEVSKDGEKCTTFADCKALLDEGKDIDYDGVTGPVDWTDEGDPSISTIGIYEYGDDNTYTRIDVVTGTL